MLNRLIVSLRARLGLLYGRSIYGALLLVVFGGLGAGHGRQLSADRRARAEAARTALQEALQRNADILALGMQESLWNMNAESAHSLVESVMRDPAVLQVQVVGQADTQFMHVRRSAS
jgi:F0F1-type ATP synthase membrane subunit c/vacuolar-type H+-ATPase subunit K